MKYIPGLPSRNSNVSHDNPLKEFFELVLGTIILLVVVLLLLGLLVDYAVGYIDPQTEAQLFNSFSDDEDTSLTEQEEELQILLDQLGNCIDVGYPVVVSITESDQMNAFAAPGGSVVVFSALLDNVATENGLAFVLAHELAHYKNRDHLSGMGRSIVFLAISVLLTGTNSDISALLTPIYSGDVAQYSQDRESAADASALDALNCHYGHVGGATEFFELLAAPDEEFDWTLTHYFSSHPDAQSRIDDLHAVAADRGYPSR
jgi:Zn-dependent protease with chaperone function